MNTLILAYQYFKSLQIGSLKARLEKTSMRFYDGRKSAHELFDQFIAAFGADGHL